MPESDVEPLELILNLRVCHTSAMQIQLALQEAEGKYVPAIDIKFTQDHGLQSESGEPSANIALRPISGTDFDDSAPRLPNPAPGIAFCALASRPRPQILSTSSHPMSSITRL